MESKHLGLILAALREAPHAVSVEPKKKEERHKRILELKTKVVKAKVVPQEEPANDTNAVPPAEEY